MAEMPETFRLNVVVALPGSKPARSELASTPNVESVASEFVKVLPGLRLTKILLVVPVTVTLRNDVFPWENDVPATFET